MIKLLILYMRYIYRKYFYWLCISDFTRGMGFYNISNYVKLKFSNDITLYCMVVDYSKTYGPLRVDGLIKYAKYQIIRINDEKEFRNMNFSEFKNSKFLKIKMPKNI